MLKIFKYPLEVEDEQELILPAGCRLLSVAEQAEKIVLYALVNPDEGAKERFTVFIKGTGHPIDEELGEFLGTVKLMGGKQMFHIFIAEMELIQNE